VQARIKGGPGGHNLGALFLSPKYLFFNAFKTSFQKNKIISVGNNYKIKMFVILYHEKLLNYNKYKIDIL